MDRDRVLNECKSFINLPQNTVPAQSRKRSAEQEDTSASTTIHPSKQLRISVESERSSKSTTAKASPGIMREGEKRQREAESENQHIRHHDDEDDEDDDEEIPHVISGHEMNQIQDGPLFDPELQTNPEIIVRNRLRGPPAEVVVSRQATSLSKPPSNGIPNSHRGQVTQTVKAPRVSRRFRRDTDESNEEAEAELEQEDDSQHEDSGVEMEASPTIRSNELDRLWGHQAALNKIFSDVKEYRKAREWFYDNEYRTINELPVIKEICDKCSGTALRYRYLQVTSSYNGLSEADERKAEQSLPDILNLVKELDPDDEGADEDDHATAVTQVYVYVFPALVHLLQAAVQYHCSIIAPDGPKAMLNTPGLDSLGKIFDIIETLDGRSRGWKSKPDASAKFHVVKDMRNKIIAKMRQIAQELCKRAAILRKNAVSIHKQKLEAEAARHQRELERQQEAERFVMKEKMARLGNLYFERLKVEPDIYRQSKLRTPKFGDRRPELDANGEPFERVSMFQERNTSHIPHEWHDDEQEWQDCENEAIIYGLKTYYGTCIESLTSWYHSLAKLILTRVEGSKRFWIRIFQRNCGRNGPLRDRKVHEILRQAKLMRSIWIQADQEQGRLTEDYILNIPDLDLLELL